MVSCMWAESIDEVIEMLRAQVGKLTLKKGGKFTKDTRLWFCATANFQPNTDAKPKTDALGPIVAGICDKNPFKSILLHPEIHDMIVCSTHQQAILTVAFGVSMNCM